MGFSIHLQISVTETINEETQTQQVASRLSREAKGSLVLDSRSDFLSGYSWWELVWAGVRCVW